MVGGVCWWVCWWCVVVCWVGVLWRGLGWGLRRCRGFVASPAGGFVVPVGVGVDNSGGGSRGDVYVADQGRDVLYKFSAGGVLLGEVALAGAGMAGVAVDSFGNGDEGDVLVAGLGSGVVYRFSPALGLLGELKGFVAPAAAAFDAAGDMFVAEAGGGSRPGKVLEFNAAGEPVDAAGVVSADNVVVEGFGEPHGLAVSGDGSQVYVATGSGVAQYSLSEGAYGQVATFGGETRRAWR